MIKINQAHATINCHKCTRSIMQGSLYLFTSCIYGSWSYCKFCGSKKGYELKDFESFTPQYDLIYPNASKYDSFEYLKFRMWELI